MDLAARLAVPVKPLFLFDSLTAPNHLHGSLRATYGITSMTRVASCSITPLSRWQALRKFRSSVNLVSGSSWTDLVTRLCLARDGSTSTRDEDKQYHRSRLVVQEYKHQADWSFFTATPPLEASRSLPICATVEELPNDVEQPVACTEPVVWWTCILDAFLLLPAGLLKVHLSLNDPAHLLFGRLTGAPPRARWDLRC